MKLQNLTVIFIIIIIPVILLVSLYISTGLKTIKYQSLYDTGLLTATHDAICAFELNTAKNEYSDNAETKRNILKSSVKMFEKSLANTCNIPSYNTDEIEEYIPAIVFGMHDGFYMYAPSYNSQNGKYEHDLKNYVYYSETLDDDIVIIYSLDNYVTVSGKFKNKAGKEEYMIKEGYLIDLSNSTEDGKKYKEIDIKPEIIDGQENTEGINYYKDAYKFSKWFKDNVADKADYLRINSDNDPEDETSSFTQHKREIIRNKIESVLNSSITAYSERTWGHTYKMPKLLEEDWQKIYSNISMITFFQGKNIGLTKYNGYCVLNSTNSNEYVNPNLMYFIDNTGTYHDIRCGKCKDATNLIGYKIGDFQKIKLDKLLNEDGTPKVDPTGKQLYDNDGIETTSAYKYKRMELACYDCINGSLATNTSVYNYVKSNGGTASPVIKTSYWTSLARERYNQTKVLKIKEQGTSENDESYLWTQEGNIIKGENSNGTTIHLQIGTKVDYNEGTGKTSTVAAGFKMKDLDWRVLGVNKQGQLELISTKPTIKANSEDTASTLTLSGEQGWLDAETKLDTLCDDLYGKGEGAAGARSLKVEDVNKLGNYTPTLTEWYRYKYDATAKHLQYSTSSNYNPKTKEGKWTDYKNTTSDDTTFKEPGKAQINSTNTSGVAELQNTSYSYTVSSKVPDTLKTPDGIKMSELITQGLNNANTAASGTNQTQWLSSRCVGCSTYHAGFLVHYLGGGYVNYYVLWYSNGRTFSPSWAVRPVVYLKSDVQIVDNNGDGVYEIK